MIDVLTMLTARDGRRVSPRTVGAWDREARTTIAVALAHGVTLREDDLIYLDVHDLQSLRWRLEHGRDRDPNGHFVHSPRRAA